jgi:hypothetical protein
MKLTKEVLKRGFWFSLTSLAIYFLIKSPITWLLTDILHVHYILSGAVSGIVVTVLTFLPVEFGIYKNKKKKFAAI